MNISSILITIVGIIIIIGLYVVSRVGQSNMPTKETSQLPNINDDNGDEFTSILDDIAATDGSSPVINKEVAAKTNNAKQQLVLFISTANSEQVLDGDLIKQTLLDNGLSLGDKDIYHYSIESENKNKEQQTSSLFRIANGVEPWTLKDKDLEKKQLVGLSMVMLLPTVIKNEVALKIFIEVADKIAEQTHGVLKNQQQQILSAEDRESMFNS
ncbi:MAG: cell division protein ZipA C-terminal FtsZ-binding domain-containing protein [Cocleimonas sp.]